VRQSARATLARQPNSKVRAKNPQGVADDYIQFDLVEWIAVPVLTYKHIQERDAARHSVSLP
jgi:hypothetical protein